MFSSSATYFAALPLILIFTYFLLIFSPSYILYNTFARHLCFNCPPLVYPIHFSFSLPPSDFAYSSIPIIFFISIPPSAFATSSPNAHFAL